MLKLVTFNGDLYFEFARFSNGFLHQIEHLTKFNENPSRDESHMERTRIQGLQCS